MRETDLGVESTQVPGRQRFHQKTERDQDFRLDDSDQSARHGHHQQRGDATSREREAGLGRIVSHDALKEARQQLRRAQQHKTGHEHHQNRRGEILVPELARIPLPMPEIG